MLSIGDSLYLDYTKIQIDWEYTILLFSTSFLQSIFYSDSTASNHLIAFYYTYKQ